MDSLQSVNYSENLFISSQEVISLTQFQTDILSTIEQLDNIPVQKILLFHDDTYVFSVYLFALLATQKDIFFPPNAQHGTTQQLGLECDAVIGSLTSDHGKSINVSLCQNAKEINEVLSINLANIVEQYRGELTFFTSGTTGFSKKIVKSTTQLVREINNLKNTFLTDLNNSTLLISTVSHQHIYGLLFKLLLPLFSGVSIAKETYEYPEHIVSFLQQQTNNNDNINTILVTSPAHIKRLVIDNILISCRGSFTRVFSSGGPLFYDVSSSFIEQMGFAPTEVYGSTETGGIAWRCVEDSNTPWKLFPNITFKVLNDNKKLEISSPYLFNEKYITDDMATKVDNEHFFLLGRADRTIKLEEKRINLEHIERFVIKHKWVNDAKVIALKSNHNRQILGVVIELKPPGFVYIEKNGRRGMSDVLKQHLLCEFERICLPKKWRYLADLPYNAQNKISLKQLETFFENE